MKGIRALCFGLLLLFASGASAQLVEKVLDILNEDTLGTMVAQKSDTDSLHLLKIKEDLETSRLNEANLRMEIEQMKLKYDAADSLKLAKQRLRIDSLRRMTPGTPVIVEGDTLYYLFAKRGGHTPQQRAEMNAAAITELGKRFNLQPDSVYIESSDIVTDLMYGNKVLSSFTDQDGLWEGCSRDQLAAAKRKVIVDKLKVMKDEHSLWQLGKRVLYFILVIVGQFLLFKLTIWLFNKLKARIQRLKDTKLKPISIQDIENRLKFVCGEENLKVTDDAIKEIAMMSNGGLRDALSILDQVAGNGEEIDIQDVIANFGGISNKKINQLLSYYENNSVAELIDYINEIKNDGIDIKVLIDKIITKIKSVLIDIKLDNYTGKLDFDNLYNLVFELNKLLTGERNGANYYDLLEIVFLKYINYFPGNNFVDKNIAKLTDSKKESAIIKQIEEKPKISAPAIEQTIISQENKLEKKNKVIDFDIDVRINNTFVNAKKDYLNNIKSKWNDFVIYESNTNKAMISYLADTNIVAASDKYAILTNNLDITNDLINQNIKSLEKDFNLFFNGNYYLVAVSPKKWEQERNKYINNIKNGYKYEIIDNDIIIKENKSELEKIASEIFGNNYKKIE